MNPLILVTGGAGYVGSHTVLCLLESNYDVIVIDNFSNCSSSVDVNSNSPPESLLRVEKLAGKKLTDFYIGDISNEKLLEQIFSSHKFSCVMHFAALKAVGESCEQPLKYYNNNVVGTLTLIKVMEKYKVKNLIFSSSATVYGKPEKCPIDENHPTGQNLTNPYGKTKYFIEEILKDLTTADINKSQNKLSNEDEPVWCAISLRYFNPVGAHPSGEIGEDPNGIPNNLMPYISKVAIGKLPCLKVFGSDYETVDGTGVRDYIHIVDLANGHVVALDKMLNEKWQGFRPINLGTGKGYSVLEVVKTFEKATNIKINYLLTERREGDVDSSYADATLAYKLLNWKTNFDLFEMCRDTWNWQKKNPNGYKAV